MDQFVLPAVSRRQDNGELEKPLPLYGAQVVFHADERPPEVRINGEVRGRVKFELKERGDKHLGGEVLEKQIESISAMAISEDDDPDGAHITFVRIGVRWFGFFDFIYNRGLAAQHLSRGFEFLSAAEYALTKKHLGACIDNLFSAAELCAKASLLLLTEMSFRKESSHRGVGRRLNYHAHLGNVQDKFKDAFNLLSELRPPARYLDQVDSRLNESTAQSLVAVVREMTEDLNGRLKRL